MLEYVAYIYNNLSGLACAVVCDKEYPPRVAFALINRCIEQFTARYPRELWTSGDAFEFKELEEAIKTYQDPVKADPILKVQKDLDETKIILHKTVDSLLERGEKLDDLVSKSDQLGHQSKAFFKVAKKTNSCCIVQ